MERPVLPSTKSPWFRYPEDLDPVLRDVRDNLDVLDSDVDDIQTGALPIPLAGISGALEGYGPLKRIVSADWFSDLNDAVSAAGEAGVVKLTDGESYTHTSGDPILLTPGITFGCSGTPAVITTDGPGFAVSDPSIRHRDVRLVGINLVTETGDVGIDWRGFTRGEIDGVLSYGFSDAAAWFGGDYPAYESSWTNTVRRSEFLGKQDGVRLSGVTGAGAPTANNISFYDSVIYVSDETGSLGVNLIEGDTNLFEHCDISYSSSPDGIAIMLGHKSWANTFLANRSEGVPKAVRTVAGSSRNRFIGNSLGATDVSAHPVELVSGTEYFVFLGNSYSYTSLAPYVDVQSGAVNHCILDLSADDNPLILRKVATTSGGAAIQGKVFGDTNPRYTLSVSGASIYTDPSTGSVTAIWGQQSTGIVGPSDTSTLLRVSKYTSLPTANATRRGSVVRIEGGTGVADELYLCIKDDTDAYVWKTVTLA